MENASHKKTNYFINKRCLASNFIKILNELIEDGIDKKFSYSRVLYLFSRKISLGLSKNQRKQI